MKTKLKTVVSVALVAALLFAAGCEPSVDDPFSGGADYNQMKEQGKLIETNEGSAQGSEGSDSSESADGEESSSAGSLRGRLFAAGGDGLRQYMGSGQQPMQDGGDGNGGNDGGDAGNGDTGNQQNGGDGQNQEGEGTEEQSEGAQSVSERFQKYRSVNFQNIIERKYEGLSDALTDPATDIPYENVGRTDPLSFPDPRIPEELRPPRKGARDIEKLQRYLRTFQANRMIDAIDIQVNGVLAVGFRREVSVTINGTSTQMSEGSAMNVPVQGGVVQVQCRRVSAGEVRFRLAVPGTSITKTKVFIRE